MRSMGDFRYLGSVIEINIKQYNSTVKVDNSAIVVPATKKDASKNHLKNLMQQKPHL